MRAVESVFQLSLTNLKTTSTGRTPSLLRVRPLFSLDPPIGRTIVSWIARLIGLKANMDQATHSKIVSFLWGIADDVLRDLFKRGKYPDVILPMCVLRRLDAVLEPTQKAVVETKEMLDQASITASSGSSQRTTERCDLRKKTGCCQPGRYGRRRL